MSHPPDFAPFPSPMDTDPELTFTLRIRRKKGWQNYRLTLPASAYVLDALEAAENQDHTLLFRHACHHASCGSCGLRINGRERLACITPLSQVVHSKKRLRLEPLRNFPWIDDLLVDFKPLMQKLNESNLPLIRASETNQPGEAYYSRLENCIECGLCVSAGPIAGFDPAYIGPAALAAVWRLMEEPRQHSITTVMEWINRDHGVWRCHAAFECSEVCPANVAPAEAIMSLRRLLIAKQG